jgi:molybdopterin-guanine dinucleotide biosynthesis protein A
MVYILTAFNVLPLNALVCGTGESHSQPMKQSTQNANHNDVLGLLLAGGLSRRFGGGDKCLNVLSGRSLLERVVERAHPQVGTLILNANGDASRFANVNLDPMPLIVADIAPGALGPLAGVLTGMAWARTHMRGARWVATFATDAPFLPYDLIARLLMAAHQQGASIAIASSNGRAHPVFALWSMDLMDELRVAVAEEGVRKVMTWVERHSVIEVDFAAEPIDPFFNINTPEDLARAEQFSEGLHGG